MLIPQFSFRTVFAGVTIVAVLSLVLASAVRGSYWAIAASVGISSLAACLVMFLLAFVAAFAIASVWRLFFRRADRSTPFSDQAPRQIIPTQDAD